MSKNSAASLILTLILISNLLVAGCPGSSKSQAKKPGIVIGQKPKAPASVGQFLVDLEKLITTLENRYKSNKKTSILAQNTISGSAENQTSTRESEGKKTTSAQSESGSKQNQWRSENQTLKSLHKTWNMLEPESVKAGLATPKRTQLEESLERLTAAVADRDPGAALESSIELYGAFAEIVEVFAYYIPADYFRTKYEAMATTFQASRGQWASASEHVVRLGERWNLLKAQAQGADPRVVSRTEFSVHDLEEAVQKQQLELVILKSEILLNNLKALKNEFVLGQQF